MSDPTADWLRAYEGKHVCITGAAGYLGCRLSARLLEVRCRITAVVRAADRVPLKPQGAKARVTVLERDITDPEGWKELVESADVIFHLAGQTSHQVAAKEPREDWRRNAGPVLHMVEACRKAGRRPRIVFASTATVVGMPVIRPVDELAPCLPLTVYDIHKLLAEHYLRYYAVVAGIPSVSLRLANVYGPSPAFSKEDRGTINRMARLAVRGEPLTIFGRGGWVRDYVHIEDVIAAFLAAGAAAEPAVSGKVFNVSSAEGKSFKDVVRMVADEGERLTGKKVHVAHDDKARLTPIDERDYIGENRALKEATGWRPRITLEAGIRGLVEAASKLGS